LVKIGLVSLISVIFIAHIISILIGFIAGRLKLLKYSTFKKMNTYMADPFTLKLKEMLHIDFFESIRQKKRFAIFFTIFINNLVLAAFISRTLYGVIFFIPLFLTIWGGLGKGMVYSKIGLAHILNPIGLFEFPAYLLSAACGVKLGLCIFDLIFNKDASVLMDLFKVLITLYPIIIFLLLAGAIVETLFLMKVELPENISLSRKNIDKHMNDYFKDE